MVISLGLAWLFTTLVLVKGVEVMGKVCTILINKYYLLFFSFIFIFNI